MFGEGDENKVLEPNEQFEMPLKVRMAGLEDINDTIIKFLVRYEVASLDGSEIKNHSRYRFARMLVNLKSESKFNSRFRSYLSSSKPGTHLVNLSLDF